ncbi:peptide chain release factor 2 [Kallotenue papyrolyticum]|uniref:peptide chain release factor 2 n=1 Tax=Kallotenue papyrolyticum TaxID=1325125 RepID=UPI00126851A6
MVTVSELRDELERLRTRFDALRGRLDLPARQQQIATLEQQAADPHLWSDPATAQSVMQRLATLQAEVTRWQSLDEQLSTTAELLELAEDDPALLAELERETRRLAEEINQAEISLLLAGPYDQASAFITVQPGAGGVDSADFAAMLLRMYTRWAERHGWKVALIDEMPAEEAGIKSATIEVRGPYAYGYAKAEAGVHRLVRLSPFDQAHRRHTSFARVEVMPEVDDTINIEIDPDDLRIDVFRSGGHGGQGVNTTDSAVRITYKPGTPEQIVVTCQNERSQLQNKETAMKVLKARLLERELERQREERRRLRGEFRAAEWGNQIRSYVLHPYNLVKDHRTGVETSNTQAVLDGEIDLFIEAYLRSDLGREESAPAEQP